MFVALLIAAALTSQVEASPPADDLPTQVRRLLRKLDAPELEVRDAAEQDLLKLGPDIVDLVPEKANDAPELQERLTRVRQKLCSQREVQQLSQPTKVTVLGTFSINELRAMYEKQTSNKIVDYRQKIGQSATNPRIYLDLQGVPFWQAMDTMLDKGMLSIYPLSGNDGLALVGRDPKELPRHTRAAYAGPFRIEANRIVAERQPGASTAGSLKVNLEIAWEPRLSPFVFVQPIKQIQAVDDQGKSIAADQVQATLEVPVQSGGTAVEMMVPFTAPPRTANDIASLKGSLTALVAGKTESFEFNKLMDAAKLAPLVQKKGTASVMLEQVRKNNELWEIVVRVRFEDVPSGMGSLRGWILQNEAFLNGADGKRIDNLGFHSAQTEKDLSVTYQFELPADLEGCTFVYKSPSAIHSVPVDYELKNLPLP